MFAPKRCNFYVHIVANPEKAANARIDSYYLPLRLGILFTRRAMAFFPACRCVQEKCEECAKKSLDKGSGALQKPWVLTLQRKNVTALY